MQKEVFVQLPSIGQRLIAHITIVTNSVVNEFDMMAQSTLVRVDLAAQVTRERWT
jgi:hypothetical protein